MKKHNQIAHADQLGFDALLAETDHLNERAAFDKAYGHLPATMDKAVPYMCDLIARHHIAMLEGDVHGALALREEASNLAVRLNNGEPGILAGPEAPGCQLAILTAAPAGTVPVWGQTGSFTLDIDGMKVRIEMDGLFGICSRYSPWMNFSARALEWDKPFISETGFRSFMGIYGALVSGLTPDRFASEVIGAHIRKELKGRLRDIDPKYRPENSLTFGVKFDNMDEE